LRSASWSGIRGGGRSPEGAHILSEAQARFVLDGGAETGDTLLGHAAAGPGDLDR